MTKRLDELLAAYHANRTRLPPVELAVLSYGRWQGLTTEPDHERQTAHDELDRCLADMEPDAWEELPNYAATLGEPHLRQLMAYSMRLWANELKLAKLEVERLTEPEASPDMDLDDATDDSPPEPKKRRRRERDR